ncbi:MAG: glycosyltransferase family 2 protein [Faecousia sp.]
MKPLVSVIIPVYNTERYLRGCLDSVCAQTYRELEILLVDDGSPDDSGAICDEYAARDARIRVLHQKNSGVCAARNAGLQMATGNYVCFVDSDDRLAENAVADLVSAALRSGAPYVGTLPENAGTDETVIDFGKAPLELLKYLCTGCSAASWAKLFDLRIIQDHDLCFDTMLKCSEDALFNRQFLCHCDRLCLIFAPVYIQNTENSGSLSKKGYPEFSRYFVKKLKTLEDLTQQLNITQAQREEFLSYRAIHGLRVSVRHYFSRFSAEAGGLVTEAVKQLLPWVHFDTVPWDRELRIWWQHHRKELEQGDLQTFLKRTRRETLLEKQRAKLARKVRALQKRITGNR